MESIEIHSPHSSNDSNNIIINNAAKKTPATTGTVRGNGAGGAEPLNGAPQLFNLPFIIWINDNLNYGTRTWEKRRPVKSIRNK